LVGALRGRARAPATPIGVEIPSREDPHHPWEAVWRGVGIALRGLSRTLPEAEIEIEPGPPAGGVEVLVNTADEARVCRTTAESVCGVALSLTDPAYDFRIETSDSVNSRGLGRLVGAFSRTAGLGA